ncbi:MAG: DUF885 domain-containing protein [bacterium]|nr:DUF885 domain-containing protein [bacterium]
MMRKITLIYAIAFVGLLVGLGQAAPKKNARSQTQIFAELSADILTGLQSFYPVTATEMGIHAYDHRLADYSAKSVKEMISRLKQYESRLGKLNNASFDADTRVDLKLIKSNVDVALLNLDKIGWHRKSPVLYVDEAINGIYYLTLSADSTTAARLKAILGRMRQIPSLFATARTNLQHPPKVFVQAARESLAAGIEFYRQVGGDLMVQFPEQADSILAITTSAREAMNSFLGYLESVQVGDDKSFAIGETNFNYMLQHEQFLNFGADSLLKIGESLLVQADRVYREFESTVEKNHQTGQDSVFIPSTFTRDDILDYYQWEVEQVRVFLEMNNVVSVPEDIAPCRVVETPPMLRTMISGIAYQPAGPFDSEQVGHFYVRPLPDSMDQVQLDARYRYVHRRGFRGSVVHEAYPGHHLQMQIAARAESPIRKWQRNNMMIEGWALFSEELAYRSGLFGAENPAQWLGVLGGIRFRAARIVADVNLHTGKWSYDDCVDWMTRTLDINTESEEEYIRREVLRYTHTPTVQMSYLMGKREIERLLQAAQMREGSNFSEKTFYDQILAEGSVPPALLWELLNLTPPLTPQP